MSKFLKSLWLLLKYHLCPSYRKQIKEMAFALREGLHGDNRELAKLLTAPIQYYPKELIDAVVSKFMIIEKK